MTLYFVVSSTEGLRVLTLGLKAAKVGWDGQTSAEFSAWRSSFGNNVIDVPLHPAEAGTALTTGVLDIYVTTEMSTATRIVNFMPTAYVYDESGAVHYADGGSSSPTDPVVDAYPTEVIVRAEYNIDSATQLSGITLALVVGTGTELSAATFFRAMGLEYNPVVFSTAMEAINAFAAGRADGLLVRDGAGVGIANQYLGGASKYDIIDLTSATPAPAPGYVKDVALLYEAGLAREADLGGLNYWIDRHETGMDLVTMAAHFLESEEFTQRFGDDDAMSAAQFVALLYNNVLERPGEAGGVEYWQGRLNAGATRETVLLEFSASAENVDGSTVGLLAETAPGFWSFE